MELFESIDVLHLFLGFDKWEKTYNLKVNGKCTKLTITSYHKAEENDLLADVVVHAKVEKRDKLFSVYKRIIDYDEKKFDEQLELFRNLVTINAFYSVYTGSYYKDYEEYVDKVDTEDIRLAYTKIMKESG